MRTYLDDILACHRELSAADTRDLPELVRRARGAGPGRDFGAALRAQGLSVIAEVKRRSPSRGELRADLDAAGLARSYADGGAACVSVLTDAEFFSGSAEDLEAVRAAVGLPVLRKDFTVGEADVYDARAMGADAILLIVSALSQVELSALRQLANDLEMAALVEVHDEEELQRALDAGAALIGVNQRNLRTFEVDRARAERLAEAMPPGVVKVAESGIREVDDVRRLAACGYDAVLVGETLVTSPDPSHAVRMLKGAR